MRVFVDADACPVVDITVKICSRAEIACFLLCDTAHQIFREPAQTLVFDKGADSVDFAIANRVQPGDIVITQDYGLGAMCLAKGARRIWMLFCSSVMKRKNTALPGAEPKDRPNGTGSRMQPSKRRFIP